MKRTPLKRTRMKQRPRKKRIGEDTEYEDFVRSMPCLICHLGLYLAGEVNEYSIATLSQRQKTRTECAHVGQSAFGSKCPSDECIPLCSEHHRTGAEAHHVLGKAFWDFHRTSMKSAVLICQKLYLRMSK